MPRDTQRRAGYRQQVESSINAPGLTTVARPNAIPTPRNDYNPRISVDNQLITESLRGLVPALSRAAQQDLQAKSERDFQAGQAMRLKATEEDLQNLDKLMAGQSKDYVRGFNYQSGKAAAARDSAQMQLDWEANKDSFVTPGQYDKWSSQYMQDKLAGVEDPDLLQGYLETFANTDDMLRSKNAEHNFQQTRGKIRDDFTAGMRSDVKGLATNGGSVEDLHTTLRSWYDQGKLMGLSRDEVNEMAFLTIKEAAIESGRPELFDYFEMSSQDVDNPDVTIPGLANSPKWLERIDNAKRQTENYVEGKQAEKDEKAKYQHGKLTDGYVQSGDYPKAIQNIEDGLEKGYYTSNEVESRVAQVRKLQAEEQKNAAIDRALAKGPAATGLLKQAGVATDNDLQKRFDNRSLQRMLDAGEDPIKQREAMETNLAEARKNGLKLTALAHSMNNASPDSPQEFQDAVQVYRTLKSIDPKYADSMIDSEQAARFDLYDKYIRAGYTEADALEATSRSGGKEEEASTRQRWSAEWNDREAVRTIDDELLDNTDAPWFGENADAADRAYFQSQVKELAYLHWRAGGGRGSMQDSLDWAIKRFQNLHTAVRLPETDESGEPRTVWIYNHGAPLPDDFAAAQQNMSDGLMESLKGTSEYDPKGYFLLPDGAGGFTVMGVSLNRPIMAGGRKTASISMSDLRSEYYNKQAPTDEETRAGQAETSRKAQGIPSIESRKERRGEPQAPDAKAQAEKEQKNAELLKQKEQQAAESAATAGNKRAEQFGELVDKGKEAVKEYRSKPGNKKRSRPKSKK